MTSFKFTGVTKTALLTGAIAVLIPLAGCASKDDDIDLTKYVETIDPADKLYNEGLANLDAGRLDEASKKFAAIDRQHPYTEWARKALVMAAFTNYRKGNYEEAISMAKKQRFDFVFLDLKLPDIPGDEVYSQLKDLHPDLPIVVITGYPDSEILSRILSHGPVTVIKKPIEYEQLNKAVKQLGHKGAEVMV